MQVFISYKRDQDEQFVKKLSTRLKTWGHTTWIDTENIQPGDRFDNAIEEGVKTSDVVIGLYSPEIITREVVRDEWYKALVFKKTFIPLKVREMSDDDIPLIYSRIQYIDFTQNQKQGFARLKTALIRPVTTYKSPQDKKAIEKLPVIETADAGKSKNHRSRMLRKVQRMWIEGVLEKSLHVSLPQTLATRPDVVLKYRDYEYSIPPETSMIEVFYDMSRRLLILGAPGSGKTITLLQIARDLIIEAEIDNTKPIPIVLPLSSWAKKREHLAKWLVERIGVEYGVPNDIAERWIEGEQLLLLLDGLDEVDEYWRDECVDAINEFRHIYRSVGLAVCSRSLEHEALKTRLDFDGAIEQQPLTTDQIAISLASEELTALQTVMQTDELLKEMAKTPFLLNALAYTYSGLKTINLAGYSTLEERRTHLFDLYVNRRLTEQNAPQYMLKQARLYLTRLAVMMEGQSQTIFYVRQMGHDEWMEPKTRNFFFRGCVTIGVLAGTIYYILPLLFGVVALINGASFIQGMLVVVLIWIVYAAMWAILAITSGNKLRSIDSISKRIIDSVYGLSLRFVLSRKGYIPFRFEMFLDYVASCMVLRNVGGGYMFMHRMLMEYFLSLSKWYGVDEIHGLSDNNEHHG